MNIKIGKGKMKKMIILSLIMMSFFLGCSNKSAGAHINNNGRGGGFIQGEVLKF